MNLMGTLKNLALQIAARFPLRAPKRCGSVQHYALTAVLMLLALWLRLEIAPVSAGLQYVTFFPAVTLAAVAGGFLPGLFATMIGLVFATFIFTPPYYSISFEVLQTSFWSNLVFLMDGIIVSFSIGTMHRYRRKYALELQQATDAQAALQKSYAEAQALLLRNQTLMRNSMEGIRIMDAAGNVIEVNDAFCTMLGYTREEALRLNVADWDAQWSREELHERFKSLVGRSTRFETAHRRKDGLLVQVEVTASGIELDGQIFMYAASRDITERKRAEAVLQRYKLVIDSANDGFWMNDMTGVLLDVNEAYARMSGYTKAELTGMHISQLDAIDRPEDVAARIPKIIAQGHDRFETRHRHKDGHLVDIEVSATFMPEARQFFVFSRDITERKQAEDALRVAAATFETHEAILITDAKSNILRVNQAFCDITGYSTEEVVGRNPSIMSSGYHDKAFYIEMWQQLLHTGSWAGEIWDKRKNGQIYPKWMTITAVRNERQEVSNYVAIFSDITARKQAEEEIRNLAFYDALTKLPNRRLFLDRFHTALTMSARRNDYGAILFIDMDRFKTLNDTLGHDYGDLLLIEVAARLKLCVREMDTVARLGGDEFVVLVEGLGDVPDDASHKIGLVAEKIRESLAQPYRLKKYDHHSSPSIGISLYHGNDAAVDVLLQQADMAMYQAKTAGRNAVHFFDPIMQRNVETRTMLENDLHQAIARHQLRLYYQVQVDSEQRPLGAEALLRWLHPERGLVLPGQFIPIAEDSALIFDIGHWMLDQACRQLAVWGGDERMRDLMMAVNISAKQFSQPDFVEQIAAVMHMHGVEPSRLRLELTESLMLRDLKNTAIKMQALKKLGVNLAMDDFGTGYASLSCLKDLPLDQIKIDKGFVQGITRDDSDALLVRTIIDMAGNFRLEVIAEGVETEEQMAFLKQHHCMAYQGSLFSEAVPIEEMAGLLERLREINAHS
ncbi:MAG: EAL domain-containing protein [Nitrosomonadales bacterium]|nr:EAL domain-containing protein [Nitrosomonadales bacterium]